MKVASPASGIPRTGLVFGTGRGRGGLCPRAALMALGRGTVTAVACGLPMPGAARSGAQA